MTSQSKQENMVIFTILRDLLGQSGDGLGQDGASKEEKQQDAFCQVPPGSDGKESACSAGDPGLIPGSGRSPGEGNGNPL